MKAGPKPPKAYEDFLKRFPKLGQAWDLLTEAGQEGPVDDDRVIFAANGRAKVVHESELSEYANAAHEMMAGKEVSRTGFRGEQLFTAAIFAVSDPKPMRAYFLQGHQEQDPSDDKEGSLAGYAYAHLLTRHAPRRYEPLVHIVLLAVAVGTLPITPSEIWKPIGTEEPVTADGQRAVSASAE